MREMKGRHLWNDDGGGDLPWISSMGTLVRRARSCRATAANETLVSAIAEGQVERLVLYDGT
jgi:hypothetical protein